MSQRSNYAEPSASFLGEEDEEGGKSAKGRARQTISDKRHLNDGGKKKKSSMAIRTALLYRKNLATLIEESVCLCTRRVISAYLPQGIASLPPQVPTYLTAVTPPPKEPPRLLCSVCGYWGKYKCKRCAMPYCDLNCEGVHNETRCERRVI